MIGQPFGQADETSWRVLQVAARLLLEYNERSALMRAHRFRVSSAS
jgi:hypothetical protein